MANLTSMGATEAPVFFSNDYFASESNVTANATLPSVTNSTLNATATADLPVETTWIYWLPGPLICAFGIVCNVLNLAVLSQKELRDSPYSFLTALACSDLILLTLSFIHLVTTKATDTMLKVVYNAYIFYATGNIFFNASVWLVVALTVDRVFFVVRPLTARPSKTKTRIGICVVFLFCALINIPRYFCYTIFEYKGHYYPKGAPFRETNMFFEISWFHAVIINFVPNLILIVTNSVLIYTLHKASQHRKSLRSNREEAAQKDQTRLTRTLVAIVIVFFICTIPSAFVDDPIAFTLFAKEGQEWRDYIKSPANQKFIYVSNLLLFLNSSLNFILYCAFNKKFRKATKTLFKRLRKLEMGIESRFSHKHRGSYTTTTSNTASTRL